MSPMAKTSGWPGTLRSEFTLTRPPGPIPRPVFSSPAWRDTRRPNDVRRPDRFAVLQVHLALADVLTLRIERTCTPSASNCRCALADKSPAADAPESAARPRSKSPAPAPDRCAGNPPARRAAPIPQNAPASSTPVGPPPTTTMVINRACSPSVSVSAFSNASKTLAANAHGVLQRFQPRRKSLPFRMPEVTRATSQRQHKVIVRQFAACEDDFFLRQLEIDDRFHQNGDVRPSGKNGPNRLRDLGGGKPRRGHLVTAGFEPATPTV
jgi:hypothetical protein